MKTKLKYSVRATQGLYDVLFNGRVIRTFLTRAYADTFAEALNRNQG